MKVLNKDYNSVSGSNQVQNLNPHPPIGMDTLDENEVDIGEVQVGLCDNMIGTNSTIWESYESYHSKDYTFTWESVEMYNELSDIPEQRDAPTKDCEGKGKVDYSSYSRKLKTKGSGWSEESSTSEELDLIVAVCLDGNNQIYPLAFGVVDRETDDSIQWFLEKLKGAIEENKMLHLKHLCKRSFRTLHSSFLLGINKPDCIVWNHIFDTHLVTPDNKKAEWTDPTAHLTIWTEKDVEYYFNTAVVDMRKCKVYVFDSMPNYVEDEALQMSARCIASLAIAIGVNLHSDHFTYGPWPIRRSKATLQKGRSLDCGIFCSKFVECLVTGSDLGCLTVPNMKLFRQQYVLELWANKYFC
ncbi:Ulp1-like peptidase [Cucumis melo var. makuwa]|uniref:Ulp1-like peptidase n=1 Tax=Cucumis melo var. makuwa TaxID=1194695 RepID=A0A5A7VL52_CUCMM|nr:Ulp1-like peptidase [Cucumis melo var. makuwa]